MKRIPRSEINQDIDSLGDPESDVYAIWFNGIGWVASTPSMANIYMNERVMGAENVAEISNGVVQYDFEYLSSADVGKHMLHNGNPALDIQLDSEYLRSDDIIYLCHRCNKAFILELS